MSSNGVTIRESGQEAGEGREGEEPHPPPHLPESGSAEEHLHGVTVAEPDSTHPLPIRDGGRGVDNC